MRLVRENTPYLFNVISLLAQGERKEARKKALTKYTNLLRKIYARRNHRGVNVLEEAWDYLIILDACRYDNFEKVNARVKAVEGKLEKRVSHGSSSSEWLKKNFPGYYQKIIYVSANPHCSDLLVNGFRGSDHFYKVEDVWKYAWNDNLDTVHPSEVTKAALKMKANYPDKKMIIHYIQPHGPWIGKTKLSVDEIGFDPHHQQTNVTGRWSVDIKAWKLVAEGSLDVKVLKQASLDNLELVLEEVKKLAGELDGRIVVSADHGEAFGEKLVFAHPTGVYTKELIEVPWFIIDKSISKGNFIEGNNGRVDKISEIMSDEERDKLEDKLKALGYLE